MTDLIEIAREVAEYLVKYHDVEDSEDIGGNVEQIPNEAMRLSTALLEAADKAEAEIRIGMEPHAECMEAMARAIRATLNSDKLAAKVGRSRLGALLRHPLERSLGQYACLTSGGPNAR